MALLDIKAEDDLPDELGVDESDDRARRGRVPRARHGAGRRGVLLPRLLFTALRNWKGIWPAAILTGLVFGGIHAGSSPAGFLVPLAVLGFAAVRPLRADGLAVSVHRAALLQQLDRVRRHAGLEVGDPRAPRRRAWRRSPLLLVRGATPLRARWRSGGWLQRSTRICGAHARAAASIAAVMALAVLPAGASAPLRRSPRRRPRPAPSSPPPATPPPAQPAPATAKLALKVDRARVLAGDALPRARDRSSPTWRASRSPCASTARRDEAPRAQGHARSPRARRRGAVRPRLRRRGPGASRCAPATRPRRSSPRTRREGQARARPRAPRAARGPWPRRARCCRRAWRGSATSSGSAALYDARTARAVLAFRKVTGLARTPFAEPPGLPAPGPRAAGASGSATPRTAATSRPTSRSR